MARQYGYVQVAPTINPCGVGWAILAMRMASLTGVPVVIFGSAEMLWTVQAYFPNSDSIAFDSLACYTCKRWQC
jgi:hypothetical protein